MPEERGNKTMKVYLQLFLRRIARIICPSVKKTLYAEDELFKGISKSQLICNNSGAWGKREISEASWFESTVLLPFEGLLLKAPIGYREYLERIYGDYMSLPPEEKRISHHSTVIIDLDKSYKEYML